jgi:hypothetical protein
MKTTANIGCSKTKAGNGQSFVTDHGITNCIIWLHVVLLMATVFSVFNKSDEGLLLDGQWKTTDCVISGMTTGWALPSICDIFLCKSMHDLTTQTLCKFMWHNLFAFCMYYMCLVTFCAAYLTLIRCKKHGTTLINTFLIGWTGAGMMSTYVSETNECITNSFTAKLTTMKHTITHVLSSVSHLLAPHMTLLKVQRRRFIKRSSTIIMLAVVFIVPIIAGSPQVSLQFCFLLLSSLYNISAHASHLSVCN